MTTEKTEKNLEKKYTRHYCGGKKSLRHFKKHLGWALERDAYLNSWNTFECIFPGRMTGTATPFDQNQINVQQTYAETFLLEGRKPLLCNKPSDMEIHDTLKHIIDPAAMAPTNAEILLRKVGQIFRSQARIPAMERLELKTT